MTSHSGPIYEVTFFVAPDVADDFDLWLEGHVQKTLLEPGIVDCNVFAIDDDDEGRARRVCLHSLESDEALDNFLDGAGADLDSQLGEQFGQRVTLSERILREDYTSGAFPESSPDCRNCGARLRGQYCGTCGQRSRGRLISLWELISDAFGDLFELDSRLWQTLVPLMIRPGRLTHDYLQGRRARYMPPFRMYLVLSLLFFVVAFFDPRESFSVLFEPQPELVNEEAAADVQEKTQEILNELTEEGLIDEDEIPDEFKDGGDGFNIQIKDDGTMVDSDCDIDASDLEELPDWLARRMTVERLKEACERTHLDNGRNFLNNLLDNIPAALIILLPLMAFVLKALYPLSKRYYVEHLLFFVHFHAFFFLILTLQILFMRLSALLKLPEALAILIVVVVSCYIPVYLYISMRRVYGQGRFVTFLKYIALVIAYVLGFSATMLGAVAIAAFST